MLLQQPPRTPGRGVLHVLLVAWLLLVGLPLLPCPRRCGEPGPELVAAGHQAGVRPEEAQRMLDWGASFPCSHCRSRRRVSILEEIARGLFEASRADGSSR
ncbi:MAG TPA: hypothetical protein VMU54_01155 [Planctomycetota bacterium]|nr:hypothetical protein [Planctomycetota bacterium]